MKKPKFPVIVKRGHTFVKIYRTPSNRCDQFTVVYYLGATRRRKTFSDLELALTEAESIANKLATGELDVLTLKSDDRVAYVRAVEALKPTGVPLEIAALQFAEASKILEGTSLLDAVRHFAKQHPNKVPRKLVGEDFLRKLQVDGKPLSGKSRNNYRGAIGTLL